MTQSLEGFSISPQQREAWTAQQDRAPLRISLTADLAGPLDAKLLKESLKRVVNRFEILRTRLAKPPNIATPLQIIDERAVFHWQETSADGWDSSEWRELLDRERRAPVDFDAGPVLRAALCRFAAERAGLALSLPAYAADALSLDILLEALAEAYDALRAGGEPEDEAVQYAQFSEWLLELETDQEEGQNYWRERLVGQTPPKLHAERDGQFDPQTAERPLPPGISAKLAETADRLGVSPDVILLACWLICLTRHAAADRLTAAVHFEGRTFEELRDALGAFARFIPLSFELPGGRHLSDLVRNLTEDLAEASENQDFYGLDRAAAAEFTAYAFAAHEPRPRFEGGGLRFEVRDRLTWEAPFALKLAATPEPAGWRIALYFDNGRFQRVFAESLLDQLETALAAAAEAPNTPLGGLPILTGPAAKSALLTGPRRACRFQTPAHRLFEIHADRLATSRAAALAEPDRPGEPPSLTYDALNRQANRIARLLRARGAGPETVVALCFERSLELVAALLGVLKTGAAYAPLDPAMPENRLRYMLADSQAAFMLAQEDRAFEADGVETLCLDRDGDRFAELADDNLDGAVDMAQTAYVIYTSGSTGQPKGVAVTHGNLVHYLDGVAERLGLAEGFDYAVVTTPAADLGNTGIFAALCLGGALHVMSHDIIGDGQAFGDYFAAHPIDCLKITPSHLAALMNQKQPERVLPRTALILGGEPTSPELLARIRELTPELTVHNHYGPSETTIGVLTHRRGQTDRFPLGRPIANTGLYPLNAQLQAQPPGAPAEAFIAGGNVTRGYVRNPAQTAERFLPDPFADQPGARMYRAGDLIRLDDHGDAVFLGRVDQQVKLRGFRIELGEIENALRQSPDIGDACVAVWTDHAGNPRLAAYIVPADQDGAEAGKLKTHELRLRLQETLPDYMIPSVFAVLDALPLTPNGKLDRRALPDPAEGELDRAEYLAPRTDMERLTVAVWQEILGVDRIGVHDNFFELGGHSFLAIRAAATLEERLGKTVGVRVLLDAPKAADFAAALEKLAVPTGGPGVGYDEAALARDLGFAVETAEAALDGRRCRVWLADLDADALAAVHRSALPAARMPQYILPPGRGAALADGTAAEALSLSRETPDMAVLRERHLPRVREARAALNRKLAGQTPESQYHSGHNPGWYVRRGVRSVMFGDLLLQRGRDPARLTDGLNRLIQTQTLLRAHLTQVGEEVFDFRVFPAVAAETPPVFDLSGYAPEVQDDWVLAIKYLLREELLEADPPLDAVLFNVAVCALNASESRLITALDHIIADYESGRVIADQLAYLNQPPDADAEALPEPAPYRQFAEIMRPAAADDPRFERVKRFEPYRRYAKPVGALQAIHPIGEPIVFGKPVHLEAWLPPSEAGEETHFLSHGLALAARAVIEQFDLDAAPLRVLVSRRYFAGINFNNTIGDFHDSVPVLFRRGQLEPDACFAALQTNDRVFSDLENNLSALGKNDEEIYHTVYKSPFNFNYVGEISPDELAHRKTTAAVFKFVSFPIFAYHLGAKIGLIFFHGFKPDTAAKLEPFLQRRFARHRVEILEPPA